MGRRVLRLHPLASVSLVAGPQPGISIVRLNAGSWQRDDAALFSHASPPIVTNAWRA